MRHMDEPEYPSEEYLNDILRAHLHIAPTQETIENIHGNEYTLAYIVQRMYMTGYSKAAENRAEEIDVATQAEELGFDPDDWV